MEINPTPSPNPAAINEAAQPKQSEAVQREATNTATDHGRANRGVDSVAVSSQARELAAARKTVEVSPEVRTDKVEVLRDQIESGTYNVDGRVVAQAMAQNALFEAIA
ncbi:MAG: flagellar biosynthesis anti-sigma factor FlgM [Leptospirillia bacterium]